MNSRWGLTVKTSPVFEVFLCVRLRVVFVSARNYPFFSLQRIFSELMMSQHPLNYNTTLEQKSQILTTKLQRGFTVRIFPFLAGRSLPYEFQCRVEEEKWKQQEAITWLHFFSVSGAGSHYSLQEVAEHCVYTVMVVLALNRHASRRRQIKELVLLQTEKNNILPVVFICRGPWFMLSHL